MMDWSKAYYAIDHAILLDKLLKYGTASSAHLWIKSIV